MQHPELRLEVVGLEQAGRRLAFGDVATGLAAAELGVERERLLREALGGALEATHLHRGAEALFQEARKLVLELEGGHHRSRSVGSALRRRLPCSRIRRARGPSCTLDRAPGWLQRNREPHGGRLQSSHPGKPPRSLSPLPRAAPRGSDPAASGPPRLRAHPLRRRRRRAARSALLGRPHPFEALPEPALADAALRRPLPLDLPGHDADARPARSHAAAQPGEQGLHAAGGGEARAAHQRNCRRAALRRAGARQLRSGAGLRLSPAGDRDRGDARGRGRRPGRLPALVAGAGRPHGAHRDPDTRGARCGGDLPGRDARLLRRRGGRAARAAARRPGQRAGARRGRGRSSRRGRAVRDGRADPGRRPRDDHQPDRQRRARAAAPSGSSGAASRRTPA